MKRILTEDNPPLLYADETAYVDRLFHDEQSIEDALTLFDVGRRQWSRVLRQVTRRRVRAPGNAQPRWASSPWAEWSRDTASISTITSFS